MSTLLHTTVKGKVVVSTIYRRSSARESFDDWYYETMVFNVESSGKLGSIVEQRESHWEGDAITKHQQLVADYVHKLPPIDKD